MIHLASDPKLARTGWRPAAPGAGAPAAAAQRRTAGHAWPFLSKAQDRPSAPSSSSNKPRADAGS